jgi:hypothetical protein
MTAVSQRGKLGAHYYVSLACWVQLLQRLAGVPMAQYESARTNGGKKSVNPAGGVVKLARPSSGDRAGKLAAK